MDLRSLYQNNLTEGRRREDKQNGDYSKQKAKTIRSERRPRKKMAFISYLLVQQTSGVEDHISPRRKETIVINRTSFQTSVGSPGEVSASVHAQAFE